MPVSRRLFSYAPEDMIHCTIQRFQTKIFGQHTTNLCAMCGRFDCAFRYNFVLKFAWKFAEHASRELSGDANQFLEDRSHYSFRTLSMWKSASGCHCSRGKSTFCIGVAINAMIVFPVRHPCLFFVLLRADGAWSYDRWASSFSFFSWSVDPYLLPSDKDRNAWGQT